MKLPMPVICECGFSTMDAGEAVRHALRHEKTYLCLRCDNSGYAVQNRSGYLVCPECGSEDLREIQEGSDGQ
jgi:DNA-directed RNA polymerase subunit RPC12/RpoP